jgi:UDP:flavonoid glycosyltransferase YjiC (YdhE family)
VNVLLCPLSDAGYLYPAIAVGRELRRRGNAVWVLGRAAAAPVAAHARLPFIAAEDCGGHRGFSVVRWRDGGPAQYRAALRAARLVRADAVLTSVLCHGALLAAEALDLPAVVLGLATHLWSYPAGGDGEPQLGTSRDERSRQTLRLYAVLRAEVGLAPRRDPWPQRPLFGEALLLRGDPALEYPGAVLPERVRHVGPLAWEPTADRAAVAEVLAHLDRVGKPVVYVHLGRFFGGRTHWPRLNATFTGGPFQAVVERGRSNDPQPAPGADILLVRKPWLGPLIERAGLVLSSGTSAPVLAALLRGRPLGLSPNGSEQPVLTAACVRAGVGVRLPDAAGPQPAAALWSAWHDRGLHDRARELGGRLAATGSAARAADAVERAAGWPGVRPGTRPAVQPDPKVVGTGPPAATHWPCAWSTAGPSVERGSRCGRRTRS